MASPTNKTETIRKSKARKRGRARKNALQNHGSTKTAVVLFKVVG